MVKRPTLSIIFLMNFDANKALYQMGVLQRIACKIYYNAGVAKLNLFHLSDSAFRSRGRVSTEPRKDGLKWCSASSIGSHCVNPHLHWSTGLFLCNAFIFLLLSDFLWLNGLAGKERVCVVFFDVNTLASFPQKNSCNRDETLDTFCSLYIFDSISETDFSTQQ